MDNSARLRQLGSCIALLLFSVTATLFAEASKSTDGTYPYNSFTIPCIVEAVKLCASVVLLTISRMTGGIEAISFRPATFITFSIPALCYFVSNNCMLLIIRELGPTTFQITNNLKVFATGVLMRVFLGRQLTWSRWKALILLVLGSAITQLNTGNHAEAKRSSFGYALIIINSFASGSGGVISEKLLKGGADSTSDPIHWQNIQLYFFGLLFGMASTWSRISPVGVFDGFNLWAYATVVSLSFAGLLVSFILKYLDNFAKCFVAAFSIIVVAVVHGAMKNEALQLNLGIGIVLTCMALEQYNLPGYYHCEK